MICVMRMNPPCELISPNDELPCTVDVMPLNCGRLNRLTTSIFTWACLLPPSPTFFDTERSVLIIRGVRTSVSVRGALPKVPAGAALNDRGLSHAAVEWAADASRSATLPDVNISAPVRFGRSPLPNKLVPELLWETPIGKPLWKLNTAAAIQPPASRFAMPL